MTGEVLAYPTARKRAYKQGHCRYDAMPENCVNLGAERRKRMPPPPPIQIRGAAEVLLVELLAALGDSSSPEVRRTLMAVWWAAKKREAIEPCPATAHAVDLIKAAQIRAAERAAERDQRH